MVTSARDEIMRSIRSHLAASAPHDMQEPASLVLNPAFGPPKSPSQRTSHSVVEDFKRNLEVVDGHCLVVKNGAEIAEAVKRIAKGRRIAVSSEPRLIKLLDDAEIEPSACDLFKIEVGVTTAQAGIAETGTLVLDSAVEQNRLVSLVPPVHIAILDASRILATLGETLALLQSGAEVSPAITFITGPSRTADIELTLAIGVHGPQELYVIVIEDN